MSEWYYSQAGQQIGPITSAQLKKNAASGPLQPADLVWKDGMAEWTPAVRVKGLFPAVTQVASAYQAPAYAPAASPATRDAIR